MVGRGHMASGGARAYNGDLGPSPQWGPGQSPWSGGQGDKAPLKLKAFKHMGVKRRWQICQLLCYSKAGQGTDS